MSKFVRISVDEVASGQDHGIRAVGTVEFGYQAPDRETEDIHEYRHFDIRLPRSVITKLVVSFMASASPKAAEDFARIVELEKENR